MKIHKFLITLAAISLISAACNKAQAPEVSKDMQQSVTATQKVTDGQEQMVTYELSLNKTALDALKEKHTITVKNYPGIGDFVESIDGTKPDSSHFWALYVNGQQSQVGADKYVLKNGDKVEWKLERIEAH